MSEKLYLRQLSVDDGDDIYRPVAGVEETQYNLEKNGFQ